MDERRREFLRACILVSGAALSAPMLMQCTADMGANLPGAASGTVTVDLTEYPSLRQENRVVMIHTALLSEPLMVTHTTGDHYFALNSHCTHQGCTVNTGSARLVCPCHGGTYSLSGEVTGGPPPHALVSYKITKENDVLTIDLSQDSINR